MRSEGVLTKVNRSPSEEGQPHGHMTKQKDGEAASSGFRATFDLQKAAIKSEINPAKPTSHRHANYDVNSMFGRVALMMKEKNKKKTFSMKYYRSRRSMINLGDDNEEQLLQKASFEVYADDDFFSKISEKQGSLAYPIKRRDRKRQSMLGSEGFNLILAEALMNENIRLHISNEETKSYIKLKLDAYGNFKKSKLLTELKKPLISMMNSQNKLSPIVGTSLALASPEKFNHAKEGSVKSDFTEKVTLKTESNSLKRKAGIFKKSITIRGKTQRDQAYGHFTFQERKKANERIAANKPIIQYLILYHDLADLKAKIFFCDMDLPDTLRKASSLDSAMISEIFVSQLIRSVVRFEEIGIYELIMNNVKDWEVFFSEEVISAFMEGNDIFYLLYFLKSFNRSLQKEQMSPLKKHHFKLEESQTTASKDTYKAIDGNRIPRGRLIQILKMLMKSEDAKDTSNVTREFLNNLNISKKMIVELLLSTGEEAKILGILTRNHDLVKEIEVKTILNTHLYSLLTFIDQMELINIMNLSESEESNKSNTVFQKLCEHLKESGKIEPICNVFMNVNQTFWDMEKLWRLYVSINEVLKYDKVQKWLASIVNPLLFFMKLATFLSQISRCLDLDSLEITKFSKDLVEFCKFYILNTSEETLLLQVTDKDNNGFCMFDYAFMLKEMTIIEIPFTEKIIHEMWDLSRRSKSSFLDFFKLSILPKEINHFSFKTFKRSYSTPVEETDIFQLEYFITSRSTYLSVLSDIIWGIVQIVLEFWVALRIINYYKINGDYHFNSTFDWIKDLASENEGFFYVFICLRCSYMMTIVARWLVIGKETTVGHHICLFYNALLITYVLQLVIYPLLFSESFMLPNILQMVVTLLMIGYGFFLGLSLDKLGVLLRIFSRMCYVVLIFAIVSIFVILFIAYPVHTLWVDFTQVVGGLPYSELNMFRNLYNGVLTLFEFVFGAVVFVRPYLEQNLHTYTMSLFMIIFSFFGNIMLANILVAFLANQFSSILKSANYFTLDMQYGLTKVLRPKDLDAVYSMPYFLTPLMLLPYIFMIKRGTFRTKINKFLRRLVFFVNIFIPWIILYNIYLLILLVFRFGGRYVQILSEVGSSKLKLPWYIILWTFLGLPFLLKLYFEDMKLFLSTLLNLRDIEEEDLFQITITEKDRRRLLDTFKKINKTANTLRKKSIQNIGLGSFIYEIGKLFPMTFSSKKLPEVQVEEVSGKDRQSKEMSQLNKNNFMFKNKYKEESIKTYAALLRNYSNLDEGLVGSDRSHLVIDIDFLLERCKNNLTIDRVHLLVTIDKPNLERARKSFQRQEDEIGLKAEVNNLNEKIEEITSDMTTIIKNVLKFGPKFQINQKEILESSPARSSQSEYKILVKN